MTHPCTCSSCGPFPQYQGPEGRNHHPYCMQELHTKCDQFKYWYDRAIELQGEPAAMAMGMMQLTEERDRWRDIAHQLRILGTDIKSVLTERAKGDDGVQQLCDSWESTIMESWLAPVRHLYRNAEVIYCAKSLDHCWELFTEDTGNEREAEEDSDPFELIPDDEVIEIASDDPSGSDGEELREVKNKDGKSIGAWFFEKKTAGEWAVLSRAGHFSGGDI